MKKIFLVGLIIFLSVATSAFAHSGRTDSSGGHWCRTGSCAGTYHYHGGGYVAPPVQQYQVPATSTPIPTKKPLPTATPTLKPSPTNTPTPSPEPEVMGESTEPSPTVMQLSSDETETNAGDAILGLGMLAALAGGGFWAGKKILDKFRNKPEQQI
jgi:hypothetical protein